LKISAPPKPLSSTRDVELLFDEMRGLQKIVWNSYPISNDIYGNEGKDKFNKLKANLTTKYGNPDDGAELIGLEGFVTNSTVA